MIFDFFFKRPNLFKNSPWINSGAFLKKKIIKDKLIVKNQVIKKLSNLIT